MRVFVNVRTRLVRIKADFSLGEGDPMAIVSSGVPAPGARGVVASVHPFSLHSSHLFE